MSTIEYGYAAARVRAMKGRLLDKAFLDRLVGINTLAELIVALEQTAYRQEIHEAILQDRGTAGIEAGLKRNIAATFSLVREVVDGRSRELVDILLGRWDVQNLKTIMRGLHVGASHEEITDGLVPAGAITEAALDELAASSDIRACLNLMATWGMSYARPLTENYFKYQDDAGLQSLEFALDEFYFTESLIRLRFKSLDTGLVREVLMREIDMTNVMTLLRLAREQASAEVKERFFLEGGKQVDRELFMRLAAEQDIDDIVVGLGRTSFGKYLKQGWEGFLSTGHFSLMERGMESYLIQANVALFRAEPLSIAVVIAYVWAKLNEVANLRIIVHGKAVKMPEPKVRQALVLV